MDDASNLGDHIEAFITELVAEGRYASRETVLRESMCLFEERERRLARLDQAIDRGLADAEAGRLNSASEVFDSLLETYASEADAKRG